MSEMLMGGFPARRVQGRHARRWPSAAVLFLGMLLPLAVMAQGPAPAPAPAPAAAAAENAAAADAPAAADSPATTAAADDAAAPAAAGDGKTEAGQGKVIQLNGVTVQGKHNPLEEGDKHLKQLQDSLPCNGCDATPHTHKKLVNRVLNAVGERVLPTEAPDHSTRDPNDKAQEFSQENNCSAGNVGGCIPSNARP